MKSGLKHASSLVLRVFLLLLVIFYLSMDDNKYYPAYTILFTVCVLVGLIVAIRKRYGALSIMYPGFWFSASWIFAILCYVLLQIWGYVPVKDDYLLRRLMFLIIITAVFFAIVMVFYPKPNVKYTVDLSNDFMGSQLVMSVFTIVCLLGALINWIGIGAPLGYVDDVRQQWLQAIPRVTAITWYPFHLVFSTAFFAGWKLRDAFLGENIKKNKYYVSCILLLLASLFWSVGTGGRQIVGFVMLYFLFGIIFRFSLYKDTAENLAKVKRKAIFVFGVLLLGFALFATITNQSRAMQQSSTSAAPFEEVPVLNNFGFFIYYMGGTLMTTQAYGLPARRDLSDTGPVSFNGMLDFGFSPFSLYDVLGIRRNDALDTNPERALEQDGQDLAMGTRNIYYDLEADFGFEGAIFVILILVIMSQFIFNASVSDLNNKNIFKLSLIVFFIMYWQYSQQLSLMMHTQFKWTLTSFALWSIFHAITRKRVHKILPNTRQA